MEYVYTHTRVAHLQFGNLEMSHCHLAVQVTCSAAVALVVVEVHLVLCTSSMSTDTSRGHFGKLGSCPFDFPEQ